MAWEKVGESTFIIPPIDQGQTSVSVPLPGNLQPKDVVFIARSADTGAFNSAPIFTNGYVNLEQTTSGTQGYSIQRKIMGTSSPPDSSVSIRPLSGLPQSGVIQVWRGGDPNSILDVEQVESSAGSGMPDPAANTNDTAGALRLVFGFLVQPPSANPLPPSVTAPAGYSGVLAEEAPQPGRLSAGVMVASKEEAAASVTDDPAPFGGNGDGDWFAFHFVLRLAPPSQNAFFSVVGQTLFQANAGGSNRTIQLPGGLREGDYVLLGRVASSDFDESPIVSPGWATLLETNGETPSCGLSWKIMGDPVDTTVVIDPFPFAINQPGFILALRGVDILAPIDGAAPFIRGVGGMPDPPGYQTANEATLRVVVGFMNDQDIANTVSPPPGYSDGLSNDENFFINQVTIMVAIKEETDLSFDDPAPFGGTPEGDTDWISVHFALKAFEGFRLEAEPGSYVIDGNDVGLRRDRSFQAEPGSYEVAGSDLRFLIGRNLIAEPGSYALTGNDVGFFRGFSVEAEPGAYVITGNEVDIFRSVILTAEPGSYVVDGAAVELIPPTWVSVDTGGEEVWRAVQTGEGNEWNLVDTKDGNEWQSVE